MAMIRVRGIPVGGASSRVSFPELATTSNPLEKSKFPSDAKMAATALTAGMIPPELTNASLSSVDSRLLLAQKTPYR